MKFIIVLLFCGLSFSQEKPDKNDLDLFKWLEGSWSSPMGKNVFYENWKVINDSIYSAESYLVSGKDTVFSESIKLLKNGKDIFYIPTVKNQNHGNAVYFKLISVHKNEYVFENKNHDFPQKIVYKNPKPDSLHAFIEGIDKGNYRKEDFIMKRIKQSRN